MIEVIKKIGTKEKEKLVHGSLDDLKTPNLVWANAINPSKKELEDISEKTKIPVRDLRLYLDPHERPKTIELNEYSLIVFAAPVREQVIKTSPVSIFISSTEDIITLSNTKIDAIDRIKHLAEENRIKVFADSTLFVYHIMHEIMEDYFYLFDELEDQVETIENNVFKNPSKDAPTKIFRMKKSLIYFHKSLTANREVIADIEKEYLSKIKKKEVKFFRELYNDVVQLTDSVEMLRDILTGTLDIYLTSVSNNLNIIMKKLAVYATIILVPTLIAGIYGMNFKFMPELNWKLGYAFALLTMVLSTIIIYYHFKKNEWV